MRFRFWKKQATFPLHPPEPPIPPTPEAKPIVIERIALDFQAASFPSATAISTAHSLVIQPDEGMATVMSPTANVTATPGIPSTYLSNVPATKAEEPSENDVLAHVAEEYRPHVKILLANGWKPSGESKAEMPPAGLPETAKPRRAKKPSDQIRPRPTQKR